MRLLERETQLAALEDWLADAAAGRGRLVLVAGEAGAGKTALLRAFREGHPDLRWLQGACDGLFTPRPLGPVMDVADAVGGRMAELARAPGTAREQLFGALLRALVEPAGPGVLVVEDVHWADRATLDLLHFLSRRLADRAAMLVVTYRDDGADPGPDLRRTLGDLVTRGVTRRVTVPPLTRAGVAELTRSSRIGPDELFRLTGGNPFFLGEALRAASAGVPQSARDAVLSQVEVLEATSRSVLDVAALLGTRVHPDLLVAVAGAGTDPGIDDLVSHGVLRSESGELCFRHDIARLAVAEAMPARRAAEIHRRALAVLMASGTADDAELAHHADGAGDASAVLAHAPAAARAAARLGSHRQAVEQYRRAVRHVGGDRGARAELLDALAVELGLTDAWDEACAADEEALAVWRDLGDDARAGATSQHLSRAYWRLARGADGERAVSEAVALLEPGGPSPRLARALSTMAAHRMTKSRDDEALEWVARCHDVTAGFDLPDVTSDVLDTEACLRAHRGEEWLALMRRSLDLALEHDLHEQAGRAYANAIELLHLDLRLEEALELAREGLEYSDGNDVGTYSRCILGGHAEVLEALGRWAEADAQCTRLLAQASSPENRVGGLLVAGRLRARRGEGEQAAELLEEAMQIARGTGDPQFVVSAGVALAEAHWLAGDDEAAAREVSAAWQGAQSVPNGTRAEVAAWAGRLGVPVEPVPGAPEPWATHLVRPAEAVDAWEAAGLPYPAALAGIDAGDEESLLRALALLDKLGAVATARLVRRRLRAAGARSVPAGTRASTRANPYGLTVREQEVLDRLVAGLGNADIAADLVISRKTVEHHVSAVLTKLDVPDRRTAALLAAAETAADSASPAATVVTRS